MNVRFAEPCRDNPLELNGFESPFERESINDGRTLKERCTTCQQDLYLGIFFDGTNNNKYRDTAGFSHSNVARLYEAYPGTPAAQRPPSFPPKVNADGKTTPRTPFEDKPFIPSTMKATDFPYYRKIYIPGVGTPMPDVGDSGKGTQRTGGLVSALLGQARLDWAMLQLCNQVHAAAFGTPLEASVTLTRLYKPGLVHALIDLMHGVWDTEDNMLENLNQTLSDYDRGDFEAMLAGYEQRLAAALRKRTGKPVLRKIRLSVFGFSRGSAEARAWVNMVEQRWGSMLAGLPLQIDFLGIFDTVASVGLAQSAPYANGHFAWADGTNMVVPSSVRRCVHLVAAFEVRGSFPLDSVCRNEVLPSNCKEIVYPGVHSDVGGGYSPEDQGRALGAGAAGDCNKLSQIPLAQMYREARMAGVPLPPKSGLIGPQKTNFEIHKDLRAGFNAYIEATRSGTVPPTDGKGDAQFARMYPTETQPRELIWRLIRRHHGYLLQWQKAMLNNGKGGMAHLPGLMEAGSDTKFQDAEDFRGAEEELRKEIAFLRNPDPGKYEVVDDPTLDGIRAGLQVSVRAAIALQPLLGIATLPLPGVAISVMREVMQDKQRQWDTWLRRDWDGEGALSGDAAQKVHTLFEKYLHDSRAWFKPLLTTDGQGMAPNDEDWFTLGGRLARKNALKHKLNEEIVRCKKAGDVPGQAAAQRALTQLQQEGQPLIHGGREPYRLWGYLRHRRIYQSGKLIDKDFDGHQQTIEREEHGREAQARRQRMMAAENARHEQEVLRLKEQSRRVLLDPQIKQEAKDDYLAGARGTLERENRFHADELRRIEAETEVAAQ